MFNTLNCDNLIWLFLEFKFDVIVSWLPNLLEKGPGTLFSDLGQHLDFLLLQLLPYSSLRVCKKLTTPRLMNERHRFQVPAGTKQNRPDLRKFSHLPHQLCDCVCFFVLCNRHWFNRVPGPRYGPGGCLSTLHPCLDTGYADLPLTLLGVPVSIGAQ